MIKIAFGGGCHWCTEAVFQSLKGVKKVAQGFVASTDKNASFSEAVMVHFNPEEISLKILTEIHLLTHKSTSNHSMREKYRSAIYTFSKIQQEKVLGLIADFQTAFNHKIITQVLPFSAFKASREAIQNYYIKNPEKPFCKKYIHPKLTLLSKKYAKHIN
ncbi:peptide-methionine (S)-S-oxide reductase [Lacinutrix sp. C3R15]|uniref:peptide-methionine (S)-S-oxide reductase n=1 Tax=Flavobacteriaceae TaxID=49546 RepID=UPI001C082C44|nr:MULTISPECIES: peptide-methionine (S)-S-oxide reductase [Flavobacteriaceae]MBU2940563.1 peptide-methionine (S)-S-oxide reductase [Lacinutrix sp. C3R15]MDO6623882.1 peptide-methionine (S)-S-oxide reductase [Oceanihabitans sp. 1_MG-2023]